LACKIEFLERHLPIDGIGGWCYVQPITLPPASLSYPGREDQAVKAIGMCVDTEFTGEPV